MSRFSKDKLVRGRRDRLLKIALGSTLILFFCLFGSVLFLQTPFAKEQIKKGLVKFAAQQELDLSIEKIEGSLPFEWTFHHVSCYIKDHPTPLSFETVKLRISIFPLWRQHLECTYLKGAKGKYGEVPFEMKGSGWLDLEGKKSIKVTNFSVEGDDFFVHMEGQLSPDFTLQKGNLSFYLPKLDLVPDLNLKGSLIGTGEVTKRSGNIRALCEGLEIQGTPFLSSSLFISAEKQGHLWLGSTLFEGGPIDLPLESRFTFKFAPKEKLIGIDDFILSGPKTEVFGNFELDPKLQCMEGTLLAQCLDLKVLRPFLPTTYLKGKGGARINFKSFSNFQDLSCQLELEEFGIFEAEGKSLTIEGNIYDVFGDLQGDLAVEGENLSLPEANFDFIEFRTGIDPISSPFNFRVRGEWKEAIEMDGKGSWQKRDDGGMLSLDLLQGFACKKPISLKSPCALDWSSHHLKLGNLSLDIGEGHLNSRIDLNESSSLIKVQGDKIPLELFSLPLKKVSLKGSTTFDVDLVSWQSHLQGSCNVALERAYLYPEEKASPIETKGSLQIHLGGKQAQVHCDMKVEGGQFFHCFGSLPIDYNHYPFRLAISPNAPLSGELVAEGKLEDVFQFVNIGPHQIEGWISTHLYLSQTLTIPYLRGEVSLQGGLYENLTTGTHLEKIEAKGEAKGTILQINELLASDRGKGEVEASGSIHLDPKNNFPFRINAQLHELETLSFDLMTGRFNGELTITGNRLGSRATGDLQVAEATFRIPDELPSVLPELPITFINPPEKLIRRKTRSPSASPLALDINLDVPGKAYVEGKGLRSELKGNLHITGNYVDIAADGTLQLLSGEYLLFGKVFNLNQGEMIFNASPSPSAYISLTGTCDLPDVGVTATLRGPLSSPKLNLQSSPPLTISNLLSQILFNKDVSEISAVQALQLAQTVLSFSGGSGPDILEKIRKTLGIDRLTLLTSESDPGKISLQVGKYLMRGVLLTLSQGRESRNLSLEVELLRGILFQAEVNEDQQGKFSLKWHHHY